MKNEKYENMPCACCGENMFNRWIRDVDARICRSCEDRHKILQQDLDFINKSKKHGRKRKTSN